MATIRTAFWGFVAAVFALLVLSVEAAEALTLTYCSSQNTGSDQDAKFWTWQSNGWCSDQCRSEYAFAVVNENDCWCSNYAPADQVDTGDCNKGCPGFPDEKCGSDDGSLFGYIRLNAEPSGTKGGSQPTSAKNQKTTTTGPTTLETSASSQRPQEPSTNTEVIFISGAPVTRTVIYTPTGGVPADATQTQKQGSNNVGAIVGGVVGGVAGIAAIVGAVFFVFWRRRRQQKEAGDDPSGITRNVSTMSKAGLLHSEKAIPQYPPRIATSVTRNSRILSDGDSISPISGSDRRNSRPFVFDQRLNPSTVLMNLDNNSRASFNSIDDSRDYGRTLNVRNPDPDPE